MNLKFLCWLILLLFQLQVALAESPENLQKDEMNLTSQTHTAQAAVSTHRNF